MTADVQRELAEALADELAGWPLGAGYYQYTVATEDAREMVEALLPLIADAENRAAARALRDAADWFRGSSTETTLRDRAAALEPIQ